MVSSLVAGLTILFERQIKVGDWVIIDGQEGIVKSINMRSTELETWNKSNVIVPNASILANSLINKTYSDQMGRVEIKVGVDYNSDINKVKAILLEIAGEDPEVLSSPPPSLQFTDLATTASISSSTAIRPTFTAAPAFLSASGRKSSNASVKTTSTSPIRKGLSISYLPRRKPSPDILCNNRAFGLCRHKNGVYLSYNFEEKEMKKVLIIAAIAVIAACHLMHEDTHDSHYFHTGHFDDSGQRR